MWISSVASMLVWHSLRHQTNFPFNLGFMFVLSDEPTDSIFLRKYAMPPALRVHYHPASPPALPVAALKRLTASNAVPVFANNGIDWWLGRRSSSGKPRSANNNLLAAQVGTLFKRTNYFFSKSVSPRYYVQHHV